MTVDIIMFSLVLFFGAGCLVAFQSRCPAWERLWLSASFVAHAVSAIVMILLTKYFFGGGDLIAYQVRGELISTWMMHDFGGRAWDVLMLTIRRNPESRLDFAGSSTGSMIGISALLNLVFFGSLYAKCLFITLIGMLSKYMVYKGLSGFFHSRYHRYILWACMLLPSMVFWTSSMLKEPMAMIGMGPLVYGTSLLMRGHSSKLRVCALILLGGFIVSLFKAYILFPWIIATAIGYYWQRSIQKSGRVKIASRPFQMVGLLLASFLIVMLLGRLFPRYSLSYISQEISNLQVIGQRTSGGSNYSIGATQAQNTPFFMLPVGLFFSLFRPFFFEVRNAALLLNALETLAFVFLWGKMFIQHGPRKLWRMIVGTPGMVQAIIFVATFGSVVGIATTNVGTLSRYRIPMMPFYVSVLLILNHRARAASTRHNTARRAPQRPRPIQGG